MPIVIEDGTGNAFKARVDSKNRLETATIAESPIQEATDDADAYTLSSTYSATGGQEVLYLRNDSLTQHMHLLHLDFSSAETSLWTFFGVTSTAAAGGTSGTVTNHRLNVTAATNFTSRGTAFGEAEVTGGLSGDRLYIRRVLANETGHIDFQGSVRLEQGDAVALTLATGTGNAVVVNLQFFFA